MSVEQKVAELTDAVKGLLKAVNIKKTALFASTSLAERARDDARKAEAAAKRARDEAIETLARVFGDPDAGYTIALDWDEITRKPDSFPASDHDHGIGEVTGLQGALDDKAPLASPVLTGIPAAPTAAPGANSTQIATTAFVSAAIAALIDSAPGAIDTLNELAAALGDDPDFAATVTNNLATKLAAAANLADLGDPDAARGNLGLGSMATQSAAAVAITGGSIDGTTIDGGTF